MCTPVRCPSGLLSADGNLSNESAERVLATEYGVAAVDVTGEVRTHAAFLGAATQSTQADREKMGKKGGTALLLRELKVDMRTLVQLIRELDCELQSKGSGGGGDHVNLFTFNGVEYVGLESLRTGQTRTHKPRRGAHRARISRLVDGVLLIHCCCRRCCVLVSHTAMSCTPT